MKILDDGREDRKKEKRTSSNKGFLHLGDRSKKGLLFRMQWLKLVFKSALLNKKKDKKKECQPIIHHHPLEVVDRKN
jgi:hypothetical protein